MKEIYWIIRNSK